MSWERDGISKDRRGLVVQGYRPLSKLQALETERSERGRKLKRREGKTAILAL
jgi:hypothetical protein